MYSIMPVEADAHSVTVAAADIISPETLDEIRFVLSKDVLIAVASESAITNAITRYYGTEDESMKDMLSSLESELEGAGPCWKAARKWKTWPLWKRRPALARWSAL